MLQVAHGDVVTADLRRCRRRTGRHQRHGPGLRQPWTAAGPVISNVQVSGVTGAEATITWDTNEPADSLVRYGELASRSATADSNELVTSHSVDARGLDECTVYLFSVTSTDAGRQRRHRRQPGRLPRFATGVNNQPEYPSSDTPIPIVDNTTITSSIVVTDEDTVLDVDVRLNATHTYTGDLDIFLIGPAGHPGRADHRQRRQRRELHRHDLRRRGRDLDHRRLARHSPGASSPRDRWPPWTASPSAGTWTLEITDDAGAGPGPAAGLDADPDLRGPAVRPDRHLRRTSSSRSRPARPAAPGWAMTAGRVGEQIEFSVTVKNDGTGR